MIELAAILMVAGWIRVGPVSSAHMGGVFAIYALIHFLKKEPQ